MDKIFSGEKSRKLWGKINQVKLVSAERDSFPDVVWEALYALGCKCQELESLLSNQSNGPKRHVLKFCPDCDYPWDDCRCKYPRR